MKLGCTASPRLLTAQSLAGGHLAAKGTETQALQWWNVRDEFPTHPSAAELP